MKPNQPIKLGKMHRLPSIGIAEYRSSIGKRIRLVLDPARRAALSISLRFRLGTGVLGVTAALLGCGSVAITTEARAALSIQVPEGQPWSPQPGYAKHFKLFDEMKCRTEPAWLLGSIIPPNSPGRLSKVQRSEIEEVNRLAQTSMHSFYGNQKPPTTIVSKLTRFLRVHPHHFYAEYLLATEYRLQKDQAGYKRYFRMSLDDAPAIMAGRVQFEDGSPFASKGTLSQEAFYYLEPENAKGSDGWEAEQDRRMTFWLDTDKDGCYYFPAYRCQVALGGGGYSASGESPVLSNSIGDVFPWSDNVLPIREKGVLLPPKILRPMFRINGFGGPQNQNYKPVTVSGSSYLLHWSAITGARKYNVTVSEHLLNEFGMFQRSETGSLKETTSNQLSFPLNDLDHPLWNDNAYGIRVEAERGDGLKLNQSYEIIFRKKNAPSRPKLTEESVRKYIPEDVQLTLFRRLPKLLEMQFEGRGPGFNWEWQERLDRRLRIFIPFRYGFNFEETKTNGKRSIMTVRQRL